MGHSAYSAGNRRRTSDPLRGYLQLSTGAPSSGAEVLARVRTAGGGTAQFVRLTNLDVTRGGLVPKTPRGNTTHLLSGLRSEESDRDASRDPHGRPGLAAPETEPP